MMKVKDLIKELKECNQEANVSFVVGNEDDNIIDTYDFEIHSKDVDEYIELFCLNNRVVDMGNKYLSTNLKDDSVLTDEAIYRAVINNVRNGNFDLVNIKTGNVVLEFQNNEV